MRPFLRFQPRSMKLSPTFLGCVLSSLAENLRFAATVEMLSLTRSRSQARVNGKRDQGLTDPPFERGGMNRARGGLRREILLGVAS